jgi:hypothetical protein
VRLGGGLTRHSRRITRPRPRATISVPRWRPGWHSRPVRQSWAGYGVPVGAGEAVVMPTSTSTDTTTSTPIGRRLAQTVGAGALGLGGSATSRAPGGQSRPLASLRTRQCGAASNPSGGASGVGGAGSPRGCRRGAGRPGGVGGAGGAGLPGRGAAGRPAQPTSCWRPTDRRRAAPRRRIWKYEQRAPGWAVRAAGCAEPIPRSAAAAVGRRRWTWRRPALGSC